MGLWFLTAAIAGVLAGYVAALTAAPAGISAPNQTLPIYSHVFLEIGISTAIVALIMLATAPALTRVIQGESQSPQSPEGSPSL
ncbi:hypothetical protein [Dongshaea marina]|uniref:hypothetical protein n=1 Tax=Dongshaea marina TaxID=2047966 RepID=UPI001F1E028E|nr:hypothetical protein [Dongshaea marina]